MTHNSGRLYKATPGALRQRSLIAFAALLLSARPLAAQTPVSAAFAQLETLATLPGVTPSTELVIAPNADLFGATIDGGPADGGTIFRRAANGVVTTLHTFVGGVSDGLLPRTLIRGADGNLYGTTDRGGV